MDHITLIAFAMSFVAGPAIAALLLRLPAHLWVLTVMAAGVIAAIWAANWFQAQTQAHPYESLIAMWLAWVLGVAMLGLALRKRVTNPRLRRWLTLATLMATTLPWFGLATAQIMTG